MARPSSWLLPLLLVLLAPSAPRAFLMQPQRLLSRSSSTRAAAGAGGMSMKADWALLFDCDGVLADTERDGECAADVGGSNLSGAWA